jgi:hypothetical protein
MRKLIQTFCAAVFVCGGASAETTVWRPSQGHTQVPIWPKEPPDAQPVAGPEEMKTVKDPLISGGKPWIQIDNVSQPTMTVYSPRERIRVWRSSCFLGEVQGSGHRSARDGDL